MLTFILSVLNLNAQNEGCYEYLSFKVFFNQKVENDTILVKEIYKTLKFPTAARIIEAEAKIELLLINHSSNELELIQITPSQHFSGVVKNLEQTLTHSSQFERNQPFVTRFYLYFDLDPFRKFPNQEKSNSIIGLVNENMFVIGEYIVPLIESQY